MPRLTELEEWQQAARVEAGLRREFYDRAIKAEAEIERLRAALWPFAAHFQFNAGYNDFDFKLASEAYGKIIVNEQNARDTEPPDPRRDCPWKCKPGDYCRCLDRNL